jgi:hypothetical protein
MKFEYEITRHSAEEFTQLVYFCSESGECNLEGVPEDQLGRLTDILNRRGSMGWELVQLTFGKDGVVAFWKRGAWASNVWNERRTGKEDGPCH